MRKGSLHEPEPAVITPGILRARVPFSVPGPSIPKALVSPLMGIWAHEPLHRNQQLFAGKSQAKKEELFHYLQ